MTKKQTPRARKLSPKPKSMSSFWTFLKKPHILFLIICGFSGYLFLTLTPPLWGLDEPSHFARAYKISHGEIIPNTDREKGGNLMPDSFSELSNYRTYDILDVQKNSHIIDRADVTNKDAYDSFMSKQFSAEEHYFPFVATYSPFAYPGSIVGIFISNILNLNIGQTLFLARLLSLLFYMGIAGLSIYLLRRSNIKWLFFVVALAPTAVFQAAVITADTMLIALSLLFFALLYRVCTDKNKANRGVLAGLAFCAIALPLIKINYVFMSATILALPFSAMGTKKRAYLYKGGVLAISAILAFLWSRAIGATETPELSQRADQLPISPNNQIAHVLHHPIDFIVVFIKSLVVYGDTYYRELLLTVSGNSVKAPLVFVLLLSVVLICIAISIKKELMPMKKQIIWLNIGAVITLATIFAALYVGFNPVGWRFIDGVQGRYFLPLLIPLLMLISVFAPIDITAKKKALPVMSIIVVCASLLVSLFYVFIALY
jgi:uncharacterized membrane protein